MTWSPTSERLLQTPREGVWEQVLPHVVEIGEDPEEVSAELDSHIASLFTCVDGFVVLKVVPGRHKRKPTLFVWIAWGRSGKDLLTERGPEIDDLGRVVGCDKVYFKTTRRGFEKKMPALGWDLSCYVWEKSL